MSHKVPCQLSYSWLPNKHHRIFLAWHRSEVHREFHSSVQPATSARQWRKPNTNAISNVRAVCIPGQPFRPQDDYSKVVTGYLVLLVTFSRRVPTGIIVNIISRLILMARRGIPDNRFAGATRDVLAQTVRILKIIVQHVAVSTFWCNWCSNHIASHAGTASERRSKPFV